jgi:ectoine hydroxylase-related dioxygenase (phytanoyl-CoA dioxygenase family)
MATIPQLSTQASSDEMTAALDAAGCLVITNILDDSGRRKARSEIEPFLAAAPVTENDDPAAFYPGHTRRATALVSRSETVRSLIVDPTTTRLCEHHLGANCDAFQLHVTAALSIGPGARSQILHREEDPFSYFPLPRPNLVLATMWAMSDFTAENGGTLLVPGSHKWSEERKPQPEEIVPAQMSAGSMLVWLGGTLHGAGANISKEWREGVILTYSLGWLRQEENQYLDVPRSVAETLTPEVRARSGLDMHGALGFHDPRVA